MVVNVRRRVFAGHRLGLPNTNARCFRVTTNRGYALFAIGTYNQHTDPAICTITRMLYPCHHASHHLAVFRRWLRTHTSYRAVATHTEAQEAGTHLQADGWVYATNHQGRKRWLRTV